MISKSRNFYFLTDAATIDNLIGLNNRVEFFVTRLTGRQTPCSKAQPRCCDDAQLSQLLWIILRSFLRQATLVVTIVSQLETYLHTTVLLSRSDRTARRVHSAISMKSPRAFFVLRAQVISLLMA